LINGAPTYVGTPGEIVGRNDKGNVIKTGDSTLLLAGIDGVIPKLPIGTRFTQKKPIRISKERQNEELAVHIN